MNRFKGDDELSAGVIDTAAEWVVEFATGEPDLPTRRAFDAWLRRSPEHVRAYIELLPLWDDAKRVDAQGDYSTDRLIQMAHADKGNLAELPTRTLPPREQFESPFVASPGRTPRALIAVAAVAVGLAVLTGLWIYGQRNLYATGIGEQRVLALEDGSSVEMNARSKLRVSYSAGLRLIDMLEGQALFRVAKDTRRPFVVASGETQVRALGTEFDVYRKTNATRVTVLEGRVLVTSANPPSASLDEVPAEGRSAGSTRRLQQPPGELVLKSGDQALATSGSIDRSAHPDLQAATAWREHRLVFSSADLTEVADEFNRYNERQIVIRNDEHLPFEVSGAFSVTDLPSLLAFLHAQQNIEVDESKDRIRVTIKR
jgi:transmembrane sensor